MWKRETAIITPLYGLLEGNTSPRKINQTNFCNIMRIVEIKKSSKFGEEKNGEINDIVTLYLSNDNKGGFLANTFASTLYAVGAHLRALSKTRVRNDDDDSIDWVKTFNKVADEMQGATDDSLHGYDLLISELSEDLFTDGSQPDQFDCVEIKETENEMSVMHIAAPDKETAVALAKNNLKRQIINGRFKIKTIVKTKEESN